MHSDDAAIYRCGARDAVRPSAAHTSNESQQQRVDRSGNPRFVRLHESMACAAAPPPCPPKACQAPRCVHTVCNAISNAQDRDTMHHLDTRQLLPVP